MATTLFPPEVLIDQPTQIYGKQNVYYLYFSFSQFNILSDIAAIQITLRDISNNNILTNEQAPYGIYQFETTNIHKKENSNMYYIGISNSWLTKSSANAQFKFQIRFVSTGSIVSHLDYNFPTWISKNSGRLSEWSEVGILQLTKEPTFVCSPQPHLNAEGFFESKIFTGNITISYDNNYDSVEKIRLKLGEADWTNWITIDAPQKDEAANRYISSLSYTFKNLLLNNHEYEILIEYQTHKKYNQTSSLFTFTTEFIKEDILPLGGISMSVIPEVDRGDMILAIKGLYGITNSAFKPNNLIHIQVMRTSSEATTPYGIWEKVRDCSFLISEQEDTFIWRDTTIAASVWYKYGFILVAPNNVYSKFYTSTEEPKVCYFEDMFLDNKDNSLRIRFDQDITNFKYVVNEQITNTLGNQYPTIFRSGNTKYRQFNISGTICSEAENMYDNSAGIFNNSVMIHNKSQENILIEEISKNILYSEDIIKSKVGEEYYNSFIKQYNIQPNVNNYIYEKYFRDKVIDILYANNVKLLRTLTEGNILVKLTNISLTPNKTLSRRIYSFSATATEIAEDTIENYNKYNILKTDEIKGHFEYILKAANSALTFKDNQLISNYNATSVLTKELEKDKDNQLILYLVWVED